MYQVSEAFKAAMKQPVQRFRLRGKLHLSTRAVTFTEENIVRGSFNIANQCSGSDNVEIGTVYTAELGAIFCNLSLSRYTLKGARIEPTLELLTAEGWEGVPLGVFTVSEANWATWGVEITAYDNMSKFDRTITISSSIGTIYDFLMLCCKACGVELGMSRVEVNNLPNGSEILSIYEENDIENWRDLVAWCAQTTGTFATIDRAGKLILKSYGLDPVDHIDDLHRFSGAKFSDFSTRYTGLSIVKISEQVTQYYGLPQDDGLTYNLGQNPLLQYGTDETTEAQRRAVLNALAVINYVPMEVSMMGSPAYDLGDVLVFEAGIADGEKLSCVTKYDWTYGGDYTVTGVGQNPALANARSKVDKNISGLLSQTSQDVMHYYDYINAEQYHIGDGKKGRVIDFNYVTTKQTHVDFHAEIKYTLETKEVEGEDDGILVITENDAILRVHYNLNGEDIIDYMPVETRQDGTHLLHLLFTWSATANIVGSFTVYLELSGGEVQIEAGDCRAYIAGQGLVGEEAWDGGVNIEDEVKSIIVSDILGNVFKDEVSGFAGYVKDYGPSDAVPQVDVKSLILGGIRSHLGGVARTHWFDPVHADELMARDGVVRSGTIWKLEDGRSNGWIQTPAISLDAVYRITSAHSGDDVAYIVSFDGGETWWTYTDDWRSPDYTMDIYGMFEGTMRSITPAAWSRKLTGSIIVRAILVEQATLSDICIYKEDFAK